MAMAANQCIAGYMLSDALQPLSPRWEKLSNSLLSCRTRLGWPTRRASNNFVMEVAQASSSSGARRALSRQAQHVAVAATLENPDVVKGKYSYDVENAINNLTSLAPRGSIARTMEGFKNKLTMHEFSLIFREFAQRSDWQKALRLFKYMQRHQWCKPNEHVYTIMIGIMGREGMLDKASELFEDMPLNDVEWNVYSFTALINAYGRNGQHEASLHLLTRMKREKVTPNLITYNTVINACAKGGLEWEGLLGLFAQMRHEGIQPDIITYNTLLSACSSRALVEEAGMIFRTMNEAGVVPDTVTYNALVDTYGQAGQHEGAADLLREMEKAGNAPDVVAYNILIEAYGRVGKYRAAAKVFKQMQDAGCSPNVVTFSSLLEAYGKHGCYDEVRVLFKDMKSRGTEPDITTYNTLIHVFGQGGFFQESINLFWDLLDGGLEPDMSTYAGLLYSCGKGGLHKAATKIHRHMLQSNVTPTSDGFTGLIAAYGNAALYSDTTSAFNSLKESGCEIDQDTYNALIGAFAGGGLYCEAGSAYLTMSDAGLSADVSTYNLLIEAFGRGGLFDDAIEVSRDMEEARCPPNRLTYEALMGVYCTAGLFDEAKAQFLDLKVGDGMPSVDAYCLMLSVCARRNRWEDASKVVEEMLEPNMPSIYGVVGGIFKGEMDEGTNWQRVEYALDGLKVDGVGSNLKFYNALLEALWCLGQRQRACRVFAEARQRGVFAEAFSRSDLMWSIDVHRMSVGAAMTTLIVWLLDLEAEIKKETSFPPLLSIVTKWGDKDPSRDLKSLPVARAVLGSLTDLGAPFDFAKWNEGRIVTWAPALQNWLPGVQLEKHFPLTNEPLSAILSRKTESKSYTGRKGRSLLTTS